MKKFAVVLVLLLVSPCIRAGSITLNFDDVSTSSFTALPSSYHGFTFSSDWYVFNNAFYNSNYSDSVTFPSQPNAAFNGFGGMFISMSSATPMSLASLSAAYLAEENMFISGLSSTNLLIIAYLNGSIVGSDSIPLGTDFALFNANLPLANSWTFVSNVGQGPAYWLADDLTFAPAATTTPEPSSLLLFGTSLLGLAAPFRRKLFSPWRADSRAAFSLET
jgi:hypothetical protein